MDVLDSSVCQWMFSPGGPNGCFLGMHVFARGMDFFAQWMFLCNGFFCAMDGFSPEWMFSTAVSARGCEALAPPRR